MGVCLQSRDNNKILLGESESEMGQYANVTDRTAKEKHSDWSFIETRDGFAYIAPVGSLKPNGFGLYDMSGNVWEWCEDRYANYKGEEQVDPCNQEGSDCVCRGGSWYGYGVWGFRSADRDRVSSSYRFFSLGARLFFRP